MSLLLLVLALASVSASPSTLVSCQTKPNVGTVVINVEPSWAPLGAKRFLELIEADYFSDVPVYRVAKDFLVQFGPAGASAHKDLCVAEIPDDRNFGLTFRRGFLSFAGRGDNTRACQLFIALKDSKTLGKSPWETPIGYIEERYMNVVDKLEGTYGDMAPWGNGPDMNKANDARTGDAYLHDNFPLLSHLHSCTIMGERKFVSAQQGKPKKQAAHGLPKGHKDPTVRQNAAAASSSFGWWPLIIVGSLLAVGGGAYYKYSQTQERARKLY